MKETYQWRKLVNIVTRERRGRNGRGFGQGVAKGRIARSERELARMASLLLRATMLYTCLSSWETLLGVFDEIHAYSCSWMFA